MLFCILAKDKFNNPSFTGIIMHKYMATLLITLFITNASFADNKTTAEANSAPTQTISPDALKAYLSKMGTINTITIAGTALVTAHLYFLMESVSIAPFLVSLLNGLPIAQRYAIYSLRIAAGSLMILYGNYKANTTMAEIIADIEAHSEKNKAVTNPA